MKFRQLGIIIWSVQIVLATYLLIAFRDGHSKMSEWGLGASLTYFCLVNAYSFYASLFLLVFGRSSSPFLNDEETCCYNFKSLYICGISTVLVAFVGLSMMMTWIFILINALALFTCILISWMYCVFLERQKQEYVQFIENVIELNSTEEEKFTREQAHALFKLQIYRASCTKVFTGPPTQSQREMEESGSEDIAFKAFQIDHFYLLSRWLNHIEKSKTEEDYEHLLLGLKNEIRERLGQYPLKEEDRKIYAALAKRKTLTVPIREKRPYFQFKWNIGKGENV